MSLPSKLHHLDKGLKGGLTFPTHTFLPFMRLADMTFKELACEENQQKYPSNIASIIKLQMKSHIGLKQEFRIALLKHQDMDTLLEEVYSFWMEKYCNVRIKDTILVAADKLELNTSKQITTTTQNLCDKLLTSHTQEK